CDNCPAMGEATGGVLRRGSDRIIAGVCSGLGQYFSVEPLLVRIVFVVLALVPAGLGIILYVVLWFLMEPPAGAGTSATRNVGGRLRTMGQEIREEFRTGFSRSSEGGPQTPPAGPGGTGSTGKGPTWTGWAGGPRGFWIGVIVIAAVASATLAPATSVGAQKVDTSAQTGGLTAATLDLNYSAASVDVNAADLGDRLYQVHVDYPGGENPPTISLDHANGRLEIHESSSFLPFHLFGSKRRHIVLALTDR